MKKIGIITLNDNNNYGNRLQNLATQKILAKLGFNAETIINKTIDRKNRNIKYYMKRFSVKKMREFTEQIIKRKIIDKKKENHITIEKRKENFKIFNENITFSKYIINEYKNLENIEKQYDYFVVGSDQVWNPYLQHIKDVNFLMFSPKKKNIAYAASFGVEKIPNDMKEKYKEGLNNFREISVREDKGQEIVETITNRKTIVTLDPTMLLTASEWLEFSKKPEKTPNKKYILTCFLGKITKERIKFFNKIAKENEFEIVNLNKLNEKDYYTIGPSEFIYVLKNASLIFTDSFHVCAFSILFKKPFYVLERKGTNINMNSRIDTLLNKFKLMDRNLKYLDNNISLNCDYSGINSILESERKKSLTFLKKALNIEEI